MYDVAIIGAGPAGISASLRAKELGLNYITLERKGVADTLRSYPRGKHMEFYPKDVEVISRVPLAGDKVEDTLALWDTFVDDEGLNIHENEGASNIVKKDDFFEIETSKSKYEARFVLFAIGVQGIPVKIPIPSDGPGRVCYNLREPETCRGKDVLVVGGGDSAIEHALLLEECGANVTISYRKPEFFRLNEYNMKKIKESGIPVVYNSNVVKAGIDGAVLRTGENEEKTIQAYRVYVFAGTKPAAEFMTKIGLKLENNKPVYNEEYESSVPGLFVAGDLTKELLIKPAVNQGYKIIDTLAKRLGKV